MAASPNRRDALKVAAGLSTLPAWSGLNLAAAAEPGGLVEGEPPKPKSGSFTIAVLPDTQNYSERYPQTFIEQTEWLVANREERNIECVLHLGDITNRNSEPEWKNAVAAMSKLDGKIPYCLVPGNHDYSAGGRCVDRSTKLNDYFPISKFAKQATFGGVYDKEPENLENNYSKFTIGDRKLLVLGLEFGPRADVIRWANEVAKAHADHEIILITHAYMYHDDARYNWEKLGGKQRWNPHAYGVGKSTKDVHDGQELWDQLVSKHDNFILTLNGHVLYDGLARLSTDTATGHTVHQLLVNFQMKPNGGDGWLRLLEFSADGKQLQTYDYSPKLKQTNSSAQNQLTLKLG